MKSTPMTYLVSFSLCLLSPTLPRPFSARSLQHSANDVLHSYNLPPGLLREGMNGFDVKSDTGDFSIDLKNNYTHVFPNNKDIVFIYDSTISGSLSKGKLTDIKGFSLKYNTSYNITFKNDIVKVARSGKENGIEALKITFRSQSDLPNRSVKIPADEF